MYLQALLFYILPEKFAVQRHLWTICIFRLYSIHTSEMPDTTPTVYRYKLDAKINGEREFSPEQKQ